MALCIDDLNEHDELSTVLPPILEQQLRMMDESIQQYGVLDAVRIWKGTTLIVDGHNRVGICKKHNIPCPIEEMEFASINEAKLWMIKNQLGRRNASKFVKCELVLQQRDALMGEGKRKQGWRKGAADVFPNLGKREDTINTEKFLAEIAGVSKGTLYCARWLLDHADEEALTQLRNDEISIYSAWNRLSKGGTHIQDHAEDEAPFDNACETMGATEVKSNAPENNDMNTQNPGAEQMSPLHAELHEKFGQREPSPLPGYGLLVPMEPRQEGVSFRAPDSVYDQPPIEVYGVIPADNMELRGKAEFAHVRSEIRKNMDYFNQRTTEILREMTEASINLENIEALTTMVTEGYNYIINIINKKYGGNDNEEEQSAQ